MKTTKLISHMFAKDSWYKGRNGLFKLSSENNESAGSSHVLFQVSMESFPWFSCQWLPLASSSMGDKNSCVALITMCSMEKTSFPS